MKAIFLIVALFAIVNTRDTEACTSAMKDLIDDAFDVTLDAEKNGWAMTSVTLKQFLGGITEVMHNCTDNEYDFTRWNTCVDGVMPALPMVGKLVADIKAGQTNNIMLDITQVGLQIANGITTCMQKPQYMELFM